MGSFGEVLLAPVEEGAGGSALGWRDHEPRISWSAFFVESRLFELTASAIGSEPSVVDDFCRWRTMMTLILEFKRKLILYRPGILRYAMRLAVKPSAAMVTRHTRRQHLSQALKRGWAQAKAERATLLRLQAFVGSDVAAGLTETATLNRTRLQ